jgi:hypothetical protein
VKASKAYGELLKALDTRMPDTELLGEGTAAELTNKRMRVLNATAQAMIEETAGDELNRHRPHYGGEICGCGFRYEKALPEGAREHQDKVLSSVIQKLTASVKQNRQINWYDVKEEADQWGNPGNIPRPN